MLLDVRAGWARSPDAEVPKQHEGTHSYFYTFRQDATGVGGEERERAALPKAHAADPYADAGVVVLSADGTAASREEHGWTGSVDAKVVPDSSVQRSVVSLSYGPLRFRAVTGWSETD